MYIYQGRRERGGGGGGGGAGETPAPVPFSGANIFFLRKIGNQKIFPCEKYVTL